MNETRRASYVYRTKLRGFRKSNTKNWPLRNRSFKKVKTIHWNHLDLLYFFLRETEPSQPTHTPLGQERMDWMRLANWNSGTTGSCPTCIQSVQTRAATAVNFGPPSVKKKMFWKCLQLNFAGMHHSKGKVVASCGNDQSALGVLSKFDSNFKWRSNGYWRGG